MKFEATVQRDCKCSHLCSRVRATVYTADMGWEERKERVANTVEL